MGGNTYDPLWSQAFESQSRYENLVEAHVPGRAYDVRLHRTRWSEPGSGVFSPSLCFIKMHLNPVTSVSGGYDAEARQPLRDVILVPPGAPLHIAWRKGIDRGVSLLVDMARLGETAGFDWSWPDFDLARTLHAGNDYTRAGMRRIAEEVLSPGFASDVQIESAVTFIVLEIRRLLEQGLADPAQAGSARLSPRQLAELRAIVLERPGAPPSIADLAAATGMSSRRLAAAHKNTTGTTLRSFIAQARLERAKALLLDGRTLVKQISYECGFRNCAAFTAAFRKATGQTPRAFRLHRAGRGPARPLH